MRWLAKSRFAATGWIVLWVTICLVLLVLSYLLLDGPKASWLSDLFLSFAFLVLTVSLIDRVVARSQQRAETSKWSQVEEAIGERATRSATLAIHSFLREPSIWKALPNEESTLGPPDFAELFSNPRRSLEMTECSLLPFMTEWSQQLSEDQFDETWERFPGIEPAGWERITQGVGWSLHVLEQTIILFGGRHAAALQRAVIDLETAETNFVGYQSTWGPGLNTGAEGAYPGSGAGVRWHQKGSLIRAVQVITETKAILQVIVAYDR